MPGFLRTRFATLGPRNALLLLLLTGASIVWCVGAVPHIDAEYSQRRTPSAGGEASPQSQGSPDQALYFDVLQRLRRGESYYTAMGDGLSRTGYPRQSIFNWRLPTHLPLLAELPSDMACKLLLAALASTATVLAFLVLRSQAGIWSGAIGSLLLFGAFLPSVLGRAFLFSELWAGALLLLSAMLYAKGRPNAGASIALAALFLRELSLLFCLVSLALAVWNRRKAELAIWGIGLLGWLCLLAWHGSMVAAQVTVQDHAHAGGWLGLVGPVLLIHMIRMHGFLLILPASAAGVLLPLVTLGLIAWNHERGLHAQLSGLGYLAAFCVVGRMFNEYWGFLFVPLLCLGAVWTPSALANLIGALGRSRRP